MITGPEGTRPDNSAAAVLMLIVYLREATVERRRAEAPRLIRQDKTLLPARAPLLRRAQAPLQQREKVGHLGPDERFSRAAVGPDAVNSPHFCCDQPGRQRLLLRYY